MIVLPHEITLKAEREWKKIAKERLGTLNVDELNNLVYFINITKKEYVSISTPCIMSKELTLHYPGSSIRVPVSTYKKKLSKRKLDKLKEFLLQIKGNYPDTGWSFRFLEYIDIDGEEVFMVSLKDSLLLDILLSSITSTRLQGKNANLPQDIKWSSIKIFFLSNDTVNVWHKDTLIGEYTFAEFGMGKHKPTRIWRFMQQLSLFTADGVAKSGARPDTDTLLNSGEQKSINDIEVVVKDLSNRLKDLFGTQEKPFYPYPKWKEYKTKFKLLPTLELRKQPDKIQTEELNTDLLKHNPQ